MADLAAWLEAIGLVAWLPNFERESLCLADLPELSESDLERLGLPMGPRKRILRAVGDQAPRSEGSVRGASETPFADVIRRSRAAIEGERRLVTILFADVKGSTDLVQHLGAEEVSALFDPLQRILIDAVHSYGGTVNEVRGDGLMAIFGAPAAQEDHALRGCQAALDMQAGVHRLADAAPAGSPARSIQLRVGLNSGEVVVRAISNDLNISYSAMGLTTHLAARIEELAPPTKIRLSHHTHRLVADYVAAVAVDPVRVKGIDHPVAVHELQGLLPARSRLEARGSRGLSPFVGREAELTGLLQRFAEAADGQGHAVQIVAEPGLGKSRLLAELRRRLGQRARWSLGQCVSHGSALAFHPVVDMLRRTFAIVDSDDPAERRRKIDGRVGDTGLDPADARRHLDHLLGASDRPPPPMDPQIRRAATFDALMRLVLPSTAEPPHVLVIEDLHWSDQASREFLGQLVEVLPQSRVLLLVTLRPDSALSLPARDWVSRLVLGHLAPQDTNRVLEAVLGTTALPEGLTELVLAKAEGNPFFVEELGRSLLDAGALRPGGEGPSLSRPASTFTVPDTIQQVLMARIDSLDEEGRRALQIAAVIGREFSALLLDRVADLEHGTAAALRHLLETELVEVRAMQPEARYAFRHALIQDVAYASMLVRRRRELHRRIATAIGELHVGRLDEQHATLGHHFAAAEEWGLAAEHLAEASSRAAASAAVTDAIAMITAAIDCARRLGEGAAAGTLAGMLARKAALHQIVSKVAEAHAAAAEAAGLARAGGAAEIEGNALAQMGLASFYLHRFPEARRESRQAIAIGKAIGSHAVVAAGACSLGWVKAVSGELGPARRTLAQASQSAQAGALPVYEILSSAVLAQIDNWQGDYGASLGRLRRQTLPLVAAGTADPDSSLLFVRLLTLFSLGLPLAGKGAYDEAFAVFSEGLALAERYGDEIFRMRFLNSIGHVLAECGDVAEARSLNELSRDLARGRGDAEVSANAELNLADSLLVLGDATLAREICRGVLGIVRSPTTSDFMRWRYAQHMFACLGEAELAAGDDASAEDAANQCLDLATRTASRKYQARGWRLKAAVARARGNPADAEAMLRRAIGFARRVGNPAQRWRAELALGSLLRSIGKRDAAMRACAAADSTLSVAFAGLQNPRLKEACAGSTLFGAQFEAAGGFRRGIGATLRQRNTAT